MLEATVVRGDTAYFSHCHDVYSYSLAEDKWTKLKHCKCDKFSLAVIQGKLTSIGGESTDSQATDKIFYLSLKWPEYYWVEYLACSPMPTRRVKPAVATTPTHLVVAGGYQAPSPETVDVLDLNTLKWSSTKPLPTPFVCPSTYNVTYCDGRLYLCEDNAVFSCSMESLNASSGSAWVRLKNIPVPYGARLATLRGQVLAIGGSDKPRGGYTTAAIHCYNRRTGMWNILGEMPTPQSRALVAVLPNSHELMVLAGKVKQNAIQIAHAYYY